MGNERVCYERQRAVREIDEGVRYTPITSRCTTYGEGVLFREEISI